LPVGLGIKLLKKLLFFVGVLASFSSYVQSKAAFAVYSHNSLSGKSGAQYIYKVNWDNKNIGAMLNRVGKANKFISLLNE
jgi:hypothetical protein